ncbi:MAG: acyltransferase family protein [Clostridia bacterium]|nr:acyltransferase family protein [Clostridia bacterium]
MSNQRRLDVDVLRGIGILVMIAGHIEFGGGFYKWSHAFHMPLFFIVSGYFFNRSFAVESPKRFLEKKIKGLIVPFWILAAICYVVWLVLKHDSPFWQPLMSILLFNQSGIPIATAIWFLPCLFFMEVFFLAIVRMQCSDIVNYALVAVLAGAALIWNCFVGYELPWAIVPALTGLPFFAVGYVLQKCKLFNFDNLQKSSACIWILAIVIASLLAFCNVAVNVRTGKYGNILLFYFNAVILTLGLWGVSAKAVNWPRMTRFCTFVVDIGRDSILYLCLNQVLITFSKMSIGRILPEETILFKLTVMLFVVGVTWGVSKYRNGLQIRKQ